MGDKYEKLFDEARGEYRAAAAVAAEKAAGARSLMMEIDELEGERAKIRQRVGDFEAGKLSMTVDEYQSLMDRLRWAEIRLRGLRPGLKNAEREAEGANDVRNHVGAKYRSLVGAMVDEDWRAARDEKFKQLDEVMR